MGGSYGTMYGNKSVCLITIDEGTGNWVIRFLGILVVRADDAVREEVP